MSIMVDGGWAKRFENTMDNIRSTITPFPYKLRIAIPVTCTVLGFVFFHVAAFSCQTFVTLLPQYENEYRFGYWGFLNGGGCSRFQDDDGYKFPKFVGILGAIMAWGILLMVGVGMQMWQWSRTYVHSTASAMLVVAIFSLVLLLMGLQSQALTIQWGPGGVVAIFSFISWLGGSVSMECCVVTKYTTTTATKRQPPPTNIYFGTPDEFDALEKASPGAKIDATIQEHNSSTEHQEESARGKRKELSALRLRAIGFVLRRIGLNNGEDSDLGNSQARDIRSDDKIESGSVASHAEDESDSEEKDSEESLESESSGEDSSGNESSGEDSSEDESSNEESSENESEQESASAKWRQLRSVFGRNKSAQRLTRRIAGRTRWMIEDQDDEDEDESSFESSSASVNSSDGETPEED